MLMIQRGLMLPGLENQPDALRLLFFYSGSIIKRGNYQED